MNPPSRETSIVALLTAIAGALMILRNLGEILKAIKRILQEYRQSLFLHNELEKQQIEEYKNRVTFWKTAIQLGVAEEKLQQLTEALKDKNGDHHA